MKTPPLSQSKEFANSKLLVELGAFEDFIHEVFYNDRENLFGRLCEHDKNNEYLVSFTKAIDVIGINALYCLDTVWKDEFDALKPGREYDKEFVKRFTEDFGKCKHALAVHYVSDVRHLIVNSAAREGFRYLEEFVKTGEDRDLFSANVALNEARQEDYSVKSERFALLSAWEASIYWDKKDPRAKPRAMGYLTFSDYFRVWEVADMARVAIARKMEETAKECGMSEDAADRIFKDAFKSSETPQTEELRYFVDCVDSGADYDPTAWKMLAELDKESAKVNISRVKVVQDQK